MVGIVSIARIYSMYIFVVGRYVCMVGNVSNRCDKYGRYRKYCKNGKWLSEPFCLC